MKRLLILVFLCAGIASAQRFDPDPSQPGAQDFAQRQYLMSRFGFMPAPIGWDCSMSTPDPDSWTQVVCVPDQALLAEQERERKEWERQTRERATRFVRSR